MEKKVCRICGQAKPVDEFYRAVGMRDGRRSECKACNLAAQKRRYELDPDVHVERVRQWQRENPERLIEWRREYRQRPGVKRRARDAHYRKVHGIGVDEADAILDAQGGRCAICKAEAPDRLASMHLDHDHASGTIRGFLCIDCNHGLGKFKDDPSALMRAVVYLREGGFLPLLAE